jgi:peroxisomal enoyl-CoA hydratase 2
MSPFATAADTLGEMAKPPSFEDLSVGDEGPPLVMEDLSRTNFVRYAGASGDFNPMHHDDTVATSVGNPSVFGHGMLTAGLVARVVKDWFGPEALRRFQVRFSKQVWPGETLTCTATVTALHEDDGVGLADLELLVENQDGEPKLTGSATAAVAKGAM